MDGARRAADVSGSRRVPIPSFDLVSSSEDEAPVEPGRVQLAYASSQGMVAGPVAVETVQDDEAAMIEEALERAQQQGSGRACYGCGALGSRQSQAGTAEDHGSSCSDLLAVLPERLHSALMPFQREGVKFVIQQNGRACIGDEMGLGKTLQAIAVARCDAIAVVTC